MHHPLQPFYNNCFIDYASYVVLERAIPRAEDGLKPVHRRILYAMHNLEDGRYNKAANIIGDTVKYHPHGDMSIKDALVQLGQKNTLIDTQGNWGNVATGDSAAAPRYIEARLTKLARSYIFDDYLTPWAMAYDGRKKEPETLPARVPLLLLHGTEGIAVGLSGLTLPHNFGEVMDAILSQLKGTPYELYPDIGAACYMDVSGYQWGAKGGRVVMRANIKTHKDHLEITALPHSVSTRSIIESISAAESKGRIKVKSIVDQTAEGVSILLYPAQDVNLEVFQQQLYNYTDAQISVSTNLCVIKDNKPVFMSVTSYLAYQVEYIKSLFLREWEHKRQLEVNNILRNELEYWFLLNKVFDSLSLLDNQALAIPLLRTRLTTDKPELAVSVTDENLMALLKLPFSRLLKTELSTYLKNIEQATKSVKMYTRYIAKPIPQLIDFYTKLKEEYGRKPRASQLTTFSTISTVAIEVKNQTAFINKTGGFIGTMVDGELLAKVGTSTEVYAVDKKGNIIMDLISDKRYYFQDIAAAAIYDRSGANQEISILFKLEGEIRVKRHIPTQLIRGKPYRVVPDGAEVLDIKPSNGVGWSLTLNGARIKGKTEEIPFTIIPQQGRSGAGRCVSKFTLESYIRG